MTEAIPPIATYQRPALYKQHQATRLLEIKQLEDSGLFAGYASVFDLVDSQRDIIRPGAFSASITERAGEVKLLWQHDMREPIGVIEILREDARGLYIRGRLLPEVARAREALSLLKSGVVKGLSIGYTPRRYRMDPDSGVRIISEVELWEISLVTFPANEAAQITVVKSAMEQDSEEAKLEQAVEQAMVTLHRLHSSMALR